MEKDYLKKFIENSINEDIGSGDYTSLATIPGTAKGSMKLLVKQNGIIAGVRVAQEVLLAIDPSIEFSKLIEDGSEIKYGDVVFNIKGNVQSMLKAERLVLNIMQRMSGIATETNRYVKELEGFGTKVIDTRKTTPGMRFLEKEAVRLGGGENHRMGLYDMIMIKDNHIDFAGGIENAIASTVQYLNENRLNLKIEIEARSINDILKIIDYGKVHRIMLDNFNIENTKKAVDIIAGRYETESSGGITLETIRSYAECGVDFISIGALTHQIKSLDLSLKAL